VACDTYVVPRFIGVTELVAVVGLVLPGLLHLFTLLIPLAAAGLVIVKFRASTCHLRRGEVAAFPSPEPCWS
jgi:hypothetical protein